MKNFQSTIYFYGYVSMLNVLSQPDMKEENSKPNK